VLLLVENENSELGKADFIKTLLSLVLSIELMYLIKVINIRL